MDQMRNDCVDAIKEAIRKKGYRVSDFDIGVLIGKAEARKELDENKARVSEFVLPKQSTNL